jgi:hypothetical protein
MVLAFPVPQKTPELPLVAGELWLPRGCVADVELKLTQVPLDEFALNADVARRVAVSKEEPCQLGGIERCTSLCGADHILVDREYSPHFANRRLKYLQHRAGVAKQREQLARRLLRRGTAESEGSEQESAVTEHVQITKLAMDRRYVLQEQSVLQHKALKHLLDDLGHLAILQDGALKERGGEERLTIVRLFFVFIVGFFVWGNRRCPIECKGNVVLLDELKDQGQRVIGRADFDPRLLCCGLKTFREAVLSLFHVLSLLANVNDAGPLSDPEINAPPLDGACPLHRPSEQRSQRIRWQCELVSSEDLGAQLIDAEVVLVEVPDRVEHEGLKHPYVIAPGIKVRLKERDSRKAFCAQWVANPLY